MRSRATFAPARATVVDTSGMPGQGSLGVQAAFRPAMLAAHGDGTVRVAVRFEAHRGLFLLHCHNLEHEDTGMMLNVEVV